MVLETAFMSIHDGTALATIQCASDSIKDVLGFTPADVKGKSIWEYIAEADRYHGRRVYQRSHEQDSASVMVWCDIHDKNGRLVRCEVCFSFCYNLVVARTSVYQDTAQSRWRQFNAPILRCLFASSQADFRYYLLLAYGSRFGQTPTKPGHAETRAMLIIDRFSAELPIMYATNSIQNVTGISADGLESHRFLRCVDSSCHSLVLTFMEGTQEVDAVGHVRFWFRDPRGPGKDVVQKPTLELEATVTCTSDGLFICLRRGLPKTAEDFIDRVLAPFWNGCQSSLLQERITFPV